MMDQQVSALVEALRNNGCLQGWIALGMAMTAQNFHTPPTPQRTAITPVTPVTPVTVEMPSTPSTQLTSNTRDRDLAGGTSQLQPTPEFERFWTAWPRSERKQSKGKCLSVWKKGGFDSKVGEILTHVEALRASPSWKKEGGQFIPAPLVYLNQRRWEGAESPSNTVAWEPGMMKPGSI